MGELGEWGMEWGGRPGWVRPPFFILGDFGVDGDGRASYLTNQLLNWMVHFG